MKKAARHIIHWLDKQGGFSEMLTPLKEHLVPPGTKWNYVWGSATLFCFLTQVITGIALAFLYQPSVNAAYDSIKYIENEAFMGNFTRGVHNWSASLMMVLMGVHMIRVYLMAAHKYPRQMNWISGLILFAITVTLAFTGQLLRWDANGVWTGILGAEQMGRIPFVGKYVAYFFFGGKTLNGNTLSRFFDMHVFLLPAILFLIVGYHLYLVFRNGISEPPKKGRPVIPSNYKKWYSELLDIKGVPFFPDVIWRDVVMSTAVLLVIILLAIIVGAPEIGKPADPTIMHVEPKPDWYFKWLYATFATMNRHLEPYYLFFGPLIAGIFLLSLPFWSRGGERHPLRRPWAIAGVIMVVTTILGFTYIGFLTPWVPKFDAKPISENIADGKDSNPAIRHGIQIFNAKGCLFCHQIGDKGGTRGPDLTKVQNRLSQKEMIIRISNGAENMPAYAGSLSGKELKDLIEFLSSKKNVEE